jgi:hypothetical protein
LPGDDVEHPVDAVGEVDVGVSGRAKHDGRSWGGAAVVGAVAVAGQVGLVGIAVGFCLDDDAAENTAVCQGGFGGGGGVVVGAGGRGWGVGVLGAGGGGGGGGGSQMVKVLPEPSLLVRSIRPLYPLSVSFTTASPKPEPGML